jgi:hypothetical protein
MIRAPLGDKKYWDQRIAFLEKSIIEKIQLISQPSVNPIYDPQFTFDLGNYSINLLLRKYSSGAAVFQLTQHFVYLIEYWELSNRLSDEICAQESVTSCRDWDFNLSNLNHYNWCFWLVGLALTLEIPDDQWNRLLALIGGAGEDALLDSVIASRQSDRAIGSKLLHTKPYPRLLKAINAPKEHQAALLREFVDHWYAELKSPAPKNKNAPTIEPFWYIYGDPEKHPLEMGSYFGRWCLEAVAAVKAFGIDDSLCLGHEHYPGDLLRPDGPSTHPAKTEPKMGWLTKLWGRRL